MVGKKENRRTPGGVLYDIYTMFHDLVYILAGISLIFVFVVRVVGVTGNSMLPTLHDGDFLALESNVIMGELERGDIIVARKMSFRDGEPIVKRVIATEGETVRMDYDADGRIYVSVDGNVLEEPYILEEMVALYQVPMEVTVEKDCIFVMGDNRNHSSDSRYEGIGQLHVSEVLGKVLVNVFPGLDYTTGERDWSRLGKVSE